MSGISTACSLPWTATFSVPIDDVRRRVDEFIENGVQHFELKIIYPTMDSLQRQMELCGRKSILPQYK